LIIAVTGKSGSGKSTYSRELVKLLGGIHVNIDLIVHDMISSNKDHVCKILNIKSFEDTKEIGEIIFANRNKYKELSELLWKKSLDIIRVRISENKIVILDHILLPHMKDLWDISDIKILVKCPDHIRYTRVLIRDRISLDYLNKREAASIEYNDSDYDKIYWTVREKNIEN
jgi:dephospho-CoA kinase